MSLALGLLTIFASSPFVFMRCLPKPQGYLPRIAQTTQSDAKTARADSSTVLIAAGSPQAIRAHPEVQAVYLGTGKTFERKADHG